MSANKASTRGFPDSATTASASASRDHMRRSRKSRSRAQRSRIGTRPQRTCAARARATICGSAGGGVFSKYPSVSPVAGFIEGRVSTEMAVAAINRFYMKTSSETCTGHEPRPAASLFGRNRQGRGAYGRRVVAQLEVEAALAGVRDAERCVQESRGNWNRVGKLRIRCDGVNQVQVVAGQLAWFVRACGAANLC